MNIKELMSEIDDELKGTFVSQETLEPNFWPLGRKLRPSIRKRLIEIAQDFFESLEIDAELKDITFTGSLANYNWSSYSDVDLHLIVNYKDDLKASTMKSGIEYMTFISMDSKLRSMFKMRMSLIPLPAYILL